MYQNNVLVVDDEHYVAYCVADLLSSQKQMNLNVYVATSTQAALQCMEQTKIDILLCDIEMPGGNGLDLISAVHKYWPLCKTILLTAYDKFEYAQKAVEIGVESYILKTEPDSKIIMEVTRALNAIHQKLQKSPVDTSRQENFIDAVAAKRQHLFQQLLTTQEPNTHAVLEKLRMLGFPEGEGNCYLIIGRLYHTQTLPDKNTENMDGQFYSIKMLASHYLTSHMSGSICTTVGNQIVWLIKGKEGDAPNLRRINWIIGTLETIQETFAYTTDMQVSFVVCQLDAPSSAKPFYLLEAFSHGQSLMNLNEAQQIEPYIYEFTHIEYVSSHEAQPIVSLADLPSYEYYLNSNQQEAFLSMLNGHLDILRQFTDRKQSNALEIYYTLALFLLSQIRKRGLLEQIAVHIPLYGLMHPDVFETWDSACDYLYQIAMKLFDFSPDKITNQTIELIKNYITDHIFENLTLADISEAIHYNPSYISRLFLEKTGENLSNYIANLRFQRVDELMRDDTLSLNEIARMTGFDSRSYFNRFVNRMTGLPPQKYREMHQKQTQ